MEGFLDLFATYGEDVAHKDNAETEQKAVFISFRVKKSPKVFLFANVLKIPNSGFWGLALPLSAIAIAAER